MESGAGAGPNLYETRQVKRINAPLSSIEILPHEILYKILVALPTDDKCIARTVCTLFDDMVAKMLHMYTEGYWTVKGTAFMLYRFNSLHRRRFSMTDNLRISSTRVARGTQLHPFNARNVAEGGDIDDSDDESNEVPPIEDVTASSDSCNRFLSVYFKDMPDMREDLHHTIGGWGFYGSLHIVATIVDDCTDHEWFADVVQSDLSDVPKYMDRIRARRDRNVAMLIAACYGM